MSDKPSEHQEVSRRDQNRGNNGERMRTWSRRAGMGQTIRVL